MPYFISGHAAQPHLFRILLLLTKLNYESVDRSQYKHETLPVCVYCNSNRLCCKSVKPQFMCSNSQTNLSFKTVVGTTVEGHILHMNPPPVVYLHAECGRCLWRVGRPPGRGCCRFLALVWGASEPVLVFVKPVIISAHEWWSTYDGSHATTQTGLHLYVC